MCTVRFKEVEYFGEVPKAYFLNHYATHTTPNNLDIQIFTWAM